MSKVTEFANPAPLGLMGFGMTTILLNLQNLGLFKLNSMILAMGIFYGGVAQIIAGVMEFRKGNTFGTTAFTSYGLFWLSLVFQIVFPIVFPASAPDFAPNSTAWASYLLLWGFFTLIMFFGTLRTNRGLQTVFLTLAALFFLLASSVYFPPLLPIAAVDGILCGFTAFYLSLAEVLNEGQEKSILPIGPMKLK
ncbi:MAG TPA: acetate uptake transporter [Candidatus Bathyarchaeia archaeon]|nr:acetate uptake transporter [Candidatus Bathyarchaeia archaeon]